MHITEKKTIFERRHQQRQQLQHNNNNNKIDKRLYAKTKIEKGEEVTKKKSTNTNTA